MRAIKTFIIPVAFLLLAGCNKYDGTDLLDRMSSIESRISSLQATLDELNEEAETLKYLVDAYHNGSTVTGIEAVYEQDILTGYKISLSDGSNFVIHNGCDGKDGYCGKDGRDGYTPVMGVVFINDRYYWTVDGNALLDEAGNMIPASPDPNESKVKDGETPVISVVDGYWVVTVGASSYTLGTVSESDNLIVDEVFSSVSQSEGNVIFTLQGGTEIVLPKAVPAKISLSEIDSRTLSFAVSGISGTISVDVICESGWTAQINMTDLSSGTILLVPDSEPVDAAFLVLCGNADNNATSSFRITDGKIEL